MKGKPHKSIGRLIDLGLCQPADIERARAEAARLSTPEYAERIRKAEKALGAVGDQNRMKILLLLAGREMCVCELEAALEMPQPTVSHHLGLLEDAELVQRSRNGRWVFYKARRSRVTKLLNELVLGVHG